MVYSPNFIPGIDSQVVSGSDSYSFRNYMLKMFAKLGETPNMLASGAMTRCEGMYDGQVTIGSLFDSGSVTTFTVNDTYALDLGWTDEIAVDVDTLLESITGKVDVREPEELELAFKNNGVYTPSVAVNGAT